MEAPAPKVLKSRSDLGSRGGGWEKEQPGQKVGGWTGTRRLVRLDGCRSRRPRSQAGESSVQDGGLRMPGCGAQASPEGCGEPRKGLKQQSDRVDLCLVKVMNDLGSCRSGIQGAGGRGTSWGPRWAFSAAPIWDEGGRAG